MRSLQPTNEMEEEGNDNQWLSDERPVFLREENRNTSVSTEDRLMCQQLLLNLNQNQAPIKTKLEQILNAVQNNNYNDGISFFNGKNLLFTQYLIHLKFYQLAKLTQISLTQGKGLQIYQRLVYLRTVLTKLPSIEKKVQYQVQRIMRAGEAPVKVKPQLKPQQQQQQKDGENQVGNDDDNEIQEQAEEDVLAYQPRPGKLLQVSKEKKQSNREGKYVAPKISSNLSGAQKIKRSQEMQVQRKKAHLIRKFRGDLLQTEQAEEQGVDSELGQKIKRKFRQKQQFQEEYMTRLPQTKKEKYWKKTMIRNHGKQGQLQQQLKEIGMIRQIFQEEHHKESKTKPIKKGKKSRK